MNEELTIMRWEEKDVRVGEKNKVNLVDVAKCCGLTKKSNSGENVVKWKNGRTDSVVGKLESVVQSVPREFQEEIQQVLIDIDEVEDRNTIYVSNWLAQRIATECKSQTAMEFKNWLVTLNCAREEIEKQNKVSIQDLLNVQQQIGELAHLMDKTVNSVVIIVKEQTIVKRSGSFFSKKNSPLDHPHSGTMRTKVTSNQVLSAVSRHTPSRTTFNSLHSFQDDFNSLHPFQDDSNSRHSFQDDF